MDGECLGRSRGGLSTKLHLAVDGRGLPMSVILTPARTATTPSCCRCSTRSRCPAKGPGRPRSRPEAVLADKAYSHPSTRAALRKRGIRFTSPERSDQIARRQAKGPRGGRPPAVDLAEYKNRNVVERCFNRLKQFRDFATRYAKRAAYYRAEIIIAATILWLR